jgi:DNA-binding LacI/PurR family transcriptional regulator
MSDIALAAGVSKGTVSRVLNEREGVGEATRKRVLKLIAEAGYEASFLAQGLAGQRANTIAVVFPGNASGVFANPVYTELLGAVGDRAGESGYALNVVTLPSAETHDRIVRDVARGRVDGVILPAVREGDAVVDRLLEASAPMVLVGHRDDRRRVVWVDSDGDASLRKLTASLIEAGHKRLAFLDGPEEYMACRLRREGFERALADAGLEAVAVTSGPFAFQYGHDETAALLKLARRRRPTAILAGSDLIAAGCLAGAREAGVDVPSELAITGYDDDRLAPVMSPPLTSVRMPMTEMGELAAKLVIDLVEGRRPARRTHVLESTLVLRESSGKATPVPG